MRLLAVELNRFRSRRAVILLALSAIVAAAVLVGAAAWQTRPLTEEDRVDAAAQAKLEGERPERQAEVRACRADPGAYLGPEAGAEDCEAALLTPAEAYYPREALDLSSIVSERGVDFALVVVGLLVIAGATFAGADWSSGSMASQLLFRPRRSSLWLAKGAAVVIGSGVVALVVIGAYWLALGSVAQARDISISSSDVSAVAWHVARAVALAMGAALGAFALTMVFRHTVATLALLFVYSVGGEIIVNLLPVEGAGRWAVGNNAYGWLAPLHRYHDVTAECDPGEQCTPLQVMTHLEAGTLLGALLVVAVSLSLVWFSRRDV